jgi:uncharacterized protein DUF4936
LNAGRVDYFIYYRIAQESADAANDAVRAVFAEVEERFAISGRLMHRLDEPLLWMEIYDDVRDCAAFEAMLERSLESHRFAGLLAPGSRRAVERFVAGAGASRGGRGGAD